MFTGACALDFYCLLTMYSITRLWKNQDETRRNQIFTHYLNKIKVVPIDECANIHTHLSYCVSQKFRAIMT